MGRLAKVRVKVSPAGSELRVAAMALAGGGWAAAVLCWDWAESLLQERIAMHKAKPDFRLALVRGVNRGRKFNTLS